MTTINQKEYLKKYLSLGSEPGKKKKRKKKSTSTSDRVKIIDDDIDVITFNQAAQEDLYAQNEDAPQIVGVIDDRPLELRISDYRDSDLWKPVGEEHSSEVRNRIQSQTATVAGSTSIKTSDNAESIPDKYNDDYSPPRRKISRFDRRSNSIQHVSPKRNVRDNSRSPIQKVTTDNDASPPRRSRRYSDASPVRRNRRNSDDASPIRRNRKSNDNTPSQNTKRKSRWSDNTKYKADDDRTPPRRYGKDRSGSPAGPSGNLAPIYRDRKTGKVRDFKREADEARQKQEKEDELKVKYAKWGKGLKQVEDATEKLNSDLHEMNKPLARYADDQDLERHLKEIEREGDPMLQYLRKKRQKQDIETGKKSKPKFEGEFMPNRYAIRPGHRWDGVDRSNGYERKWFEIMNSRRAQQEDAYKWSTEDM